MSEHPTTSGYGGDPQHEPLHQPPDSRDLRAFPPAGPECAIVRGRLRDYVDGDLTPAARAHVEDHAHACRACAVALSRAEHEVMRLQRAFGTIALNEPGAGLPQRGFARRVVDRLVLDETSMLSREVMQAVRAQVQEADVPGTPASSSGGGASGSWGSGARRGGRGRRPLSRLTAGSVLASIGLLMLLSVVYTVWSDADRGPQRVARLVITEASDTYGEHGRLGSGDGLGNDQTLYVGAHGEAWIDWHDASPKSQPAATLQVTNHGQVRMQRGEPLVENGTVQVGSQRPVSIPIADGSRVELGVGEYLVSVESRRRNGLNPLGNAPGDLRVSVEVVRGDGAHIVRPEVGSVAVIQGQIGIYHGDSAVSFVSGSNPIDNGASIVRRPDAPAKADPVPVKVRGMVIERTGAPAIGADVVLSFGAGGVQRSQAGRVAPDGTFEIASGPLGLPTACDSPFAIVQVMPAVDQTGYGLTTAEAYRLIYQNGDARLLGTPVIDISAPLFGRVVDDTGMPRGGVHVVPCVSDELFRGLLPWPEGQSITDALGNFRLSRLPVSLPEHQHLELVFLHPDLAPKAVPAPARGSLAARSVWDHVEVPRTRLVHVQLPSPGTFQVFEDIDGLPPGMVMYQRVVSSQGLVAEMRVGTGQLWLRNTNPSHPMVRRLAYSDLEPPTLQTAPGGVPEPLESVFQSMQPIADTDLSVSSSFRYQRFSTVSAENLANAPMTGSMLYAIDGLSNRAVVGAQVFAVQGTGPRGIGAVRFLGFTNGNGALPLQAMAGGAGETGIVVVASNSAVGFVAAPANGGDVTVPVPSNGRILLDSSLLPGPGSSQDVVTVRLQRVDLPIDGLAPELVRFAVAAGGWELNDIPPGEYRAVIDGHARAVEVPTSGAVVLH